MVELNEGDMAIYRTVQRQLHALPNGFPATADGSDLRLLAKMFSPEEATLAAAMSGTPESHEAIAARAGVDPKAAHRTLKEMVRHGLITVQKADHALHFALMPFVVGSYEAQLPRMDAELAQLFDDYFYATRGLDLPGPSFHRVIPVGEAVEANVEIHPFEQASALVEAAKSWAVRDCICRVQQHLVGKGCDAPIDNCLMFAPVEHAFHDDGIIRVLTKEEALQVLREAADAGLVHSVSNHRDDNHYICNCCTCCCGVLRRVAEFAVPTAIAQSAFRAVVDEAACIGCGACEERCQFSAITLPEGTAVVDTARCVGCGQCTLACPSEAIALTRRPDTEIIAPPVDEAAWAEARRQARSQAAD